MADANELLRLLQAHGEQFMTSFSSHPARSDIKAQPSDTPHSSDEGSEWGGIDQSSQEEEQDSLDEYSDYNDDEFVQGSSTAPHVVIHSEPKAEKSKDHANGKLFMSPRISKLRSDKIAERKITDEHETDERSNIENDALLYRLVHTKLLSGSLSSDLELTHAQRQKALSGRVLELSGSAKLGRGEKTVRNEEHNKASKRVREGLLSKEKQRRKARLEEAKNLGNYHPKLKRLFEDSRIEKKPQKRQRGLQMGIGHFSGGTLKLSRDEIDMVHGQSSRQKRSRLRGRR